ncbi:MAG: 50S ribosomal protein L25 [Eubacteriaceae bacterium]|nr:50S ribosomal protein L25 [Eubacteriaceae bacterium]
MMMFTLNAENRNTGLKPKQLRRKGTIPGVLYGKDLEKSLSIQFSGAEATRFLKSNSTGSKAELVIGDKRFTALLREATYKPATDELEHLSFQMLLAGEIVTSTARIVLVNRDRVSGMVQQPQSDISYRALPSHLIDRIEIDLEGMKVGSSIRISDLDIAKNPNIEILNPLDTTVLSIADTRKPVETLEIDDEASKTE